MTIKLFDPEGEVEAPYLIGRVVCDDAVFEWWSDGWRSEQNPDLAAAVNRAYDQGLDTTQPDAYDKRLAQICLALRGKSWECVLQDDFVPGRIY